MTKEISPKGFKEYTSDDKGQLIAQREQSSKQGITDKESRFAYNDKGMLLSKIGSSKGKAFSSHIAYEKYGRVIAASEESFGKKYERMKELDRKLHEKDMTFFYTDFVVEKVIKNGNS